MTRAAHRAATVAGECAAEPSGWRRMPCASGEAVLPWACCRAWCATGSPPRPRARPRPRQRAAGRAARTMLDLLVGALRGGIIFVMAALTLSGQNVNAAFGGAILVMGMVVSPFLGVGVHLRSLTEAMAAWQRLRAMMRSHGGDPGGHRLPAPGGAADRGAPGLRLPRPAAGAVPQPAAGGRRRRDRRHRRSLRQRQEHAAAAAGGHPAAGRRRRVPGWPRHQPMGPAGAGAHLGYLPQEALLSRATAAEVIARLEAPDMAEVMEAAQRAGAHATIIGLPCGYATPLTGGWQLSMGQRHRIALARALVWPAAGCWCWTSWPARWTRRRSRGRAAAAPAEGGRHRGASSPRIGRACWPPPTACWRSARASWCRPARNGRSCRGGRRNCRGRAARRWWRHERHPSPRMPRACGCATSA